jgi:phospholipase/lecithinase/hemolysin
MMYRSVLGLALMLGLSTAAAADPTNVIVFGDSLVDSGNIFAATGGASPSAAQGYFQGRFQDGYNFADLLNFKLAGAPTTASLTGGDNWAYGGARGTGVGGFPVPGLNGQLATFNLFGPRGFSPSSLVILNFGGNDVFGLESGDIGGLTPTQFASLYISNMQTAVLALDAAGAGQILVMGVPNGTPTGFALNAQLQSMLDSIEPTLEAQLFRFSYFDFYGRLLADPAAYGFPNGVNTSTPCTAVRPVVNGKIDCSGLFSFDGIHFTAQVHRGIYRDLVQVVGVPESATWAMLIAGFGLVGTAARRRRAQAAA